MRAVVLAPCLVAVWPLSCDKWAATSCGFGQSSHNSVPFNLLLSGFSQEPVSTTHPSWCLKREVLKSERRYTQWPLRYLIPFRQSSYIPGLHISSNSSSFTLNVCVFWLCGFFWGGMFPSMTQSLEMLSGTAPSTAWSVTCWGWWRAGPSSATSGTCQPCTNRWVRHELNRVHQVQPLPLPPVNV